MNSPARSPSACEMTAFSLPPLGHAKPGPLFTIIRDEQGSIYYSDEMNHAVVSLDSKGELRWVKSDCGPSAERFRYPRGLALGWISEQGALVRSLAVCDAWNNRVVFLDPEGRFLDEWVKGGELRFIDVSDIRFISEGCPRAPGMIGTDAHWLALDRGNHRLCGLDLHGRMLFQVGRGLSPALTPRWRASGLDPRPGSTMSGVAGDFLPFDPLFYPMRIIGSAEDNLYIWEPLSGSLKQLLLDNLFPIRIHPSCEQWIAADPSGLLGWCPRLHALRRYDCDGQLQQQIPVDGAPVPSAEPPSVFWTQSGSKVARHLIHAPEGETRMEARRFSILQSTALRQIYQFRRESAVNAIDACLRSADSYLSLADQVLRLSKTQLSPYEESVHDLSAKLNAQRERTEHVFSDLGSVLHDYRLGTVTLRLLGDLGLRNGVCRLPESTREIMKKLVKPFLSTFPRLAECADALFLTCSSLQASSPEGISRNDESLLARLYQDIDQTAYRLYCWCKIYDGGGAAGLPGFAETREAIGCSDGETCTPGQPPGGGSPRTRRGSPARFREIDRIALGSPAGSAARPYAPAISSEGHLLVSLFSAGAILQLDRNGKLLAQFGRAPHSADFLQGPLGIAVDARLRLWIVDHLQNKVLIWDAAEGVVRALDSIEVQVGNLSSPVGICRGPDDSMLVADTGNHRVVQMSQEGLCRVFCGGQGKRPGEFRQPNSLCSGIEGASSSAYWVVDHRNHRVQKVDARGTYLQEIGKCGLQHGELYLPESVVQFPDGTLIVSQGHLDRCLKLFSPNGEELGYLSLDYAPGGMLALDGRLLVTEFDGSTIRVYELRTGYA